MVDFPQEVRADVLEGTVEIWIRVDERGNVKDWRIKRSMSDPIDSAVVAGVRSLRYKPKAINGRAVAGGEVTIRYPVAGYYYGHGLNQYEHAFANYSKLLGAEIHTIGALYYTERLYGRGRVSFIHGADEAARADFEFAKKRGWTLPWYGEVHRALVDHLLPRDTTNRDSVIKYGRLLSEYQLYRESTEILERVLRRWGEEEDVIRLLATNYTELLDEQMYWDMVGWLIQHGDSTETTLVRGSWAAYLARDDRSALDLCDTLIARFPRSQNTLGNKALTLLSLGSVEEATAIYKSIESDEGWPEHNVIADLKRHIGIGFPSQDDARRILAFVFKIPSEYIP